MDLSETERLEFSQVRLKLSEAIRIGAKHVPNQCSYRGCALGAAYFALTGKDLSLATLNLKAKRPFATYIARLFNAPVKIVIQAEECHMLGQQRERIADWLSSMGH